MTDAFREYLYRPRVLVDRLLDLDVERYKLWSACTKMSTTFGQIGGVGGSGGDAKDGDKAALSDMNDLYDALTRETRAVLQEMFQFSDAVAQDPRNPHGPRDAAILRLRYARRLDWNAVARELQTRGFRWVSLRTVFKWHSDALTRIEKIWEETHEHCGKE